MFFDELFITESDIIDSYSEYDLEITDEACKKEACKKEACKKEGCSKEACKKEACKKEGCSGKKCEGSCEKGFEDDDMVEESFFNDTFDLL